MGGALTQQLFGTNSISDDGSEIEDEESGEITLSEHERIEMRIRD